MELQPHSIEPPLHAGRRRRRRSEQNWPADVAALDTNAQRQTRKQAPVVGNATPELPDLMFTRLCLLLHDTKGLTAARGAADLARVGVYCSGAGEEGR